MHYKTKWFFKRYDLISLEGTIYVTLIFRQTVAI